MSKKEAFARLAYEVDFSTSDGMFIKQIRIPRKGTLIPQHVHKYDHSTLLARGSVLLWKDPLDGTRRKCSLHRAPAILSIAAGVVHEFQSMEDETLLYCLHNLKGADGVELLSEHNISFEDLEEFA